MDIKYVSSTRVVLEFLQGTRIQLWAPAGLYGKFKGTVAELWALGLLQCLRVRFKSTHKATQLGSRALCGHLGVRFRTPVRA